jgi:hypothetical protein
MLKKLEWVTGFGVLGLILSSIASVLNAIKGGPWTSGVMAGALLSLALAIIPFLKSTQQFHTRVEALMAAIGPDRDALASLRQLLRSVMFRDQHVFDPVFWTAYGQSVLSRNELDQYERMKAVAEAAEAKKVRVSKADAYTMMGLLFHRIQAQHLRYLATATEAETKDPAAQVLLFEFPKQQPFLVQRLFIVTNYQSFISGLSESQSNDIIAQCKRPGIASLHGPSTSIEGASLRVTN